MRGLDIDPVNHLIYTVGAYWNRTYEFSYDPAKVAAGTGASSIVGKFVNEWRNMDGTNFASGHQQMDSVRFPAVDGQGNVYVGETWGCDAGCTGTPYGYGVEKYAPGSISAFPSCTVANATPDHLCRCHQAAVGDRPQPPPRGGFNQQNGIAIDPSDNSLFVVDTFEQRVQKFDSTSTCTSEASCPAWELQWGSRQPASPASDGFGYPRALTFGDGMVWVGDNNNAVITFKPDGTFVHRYGSQGPQPGMFKGGCAGHPRRERQGLRHRRGRLPPAGVRRGEASERVQHRHRPGRDAAGEPGSCGSGVNQMTAPRGVAVSPDGNTVYVAETGNNRISVWNLNTNSATTVKPSCGGKVPRPALGHHLGSRQDVALHRRRRQQARRTLGSGLRYLPGGCNDRHTARRIHHGRQQLPRVGPDGRLYASDNSRHIYAFTITG